MYRSRPQTPDQCDNLLQLFEERLQDIFKLKSSFVLTTGDSNCKNFNWYLGDPVTPQGARVEALTSFYGLNQLIKTPTHLLQNSATCIDLVFTNQPHLVMESGVHRSVSSTCHHQIVFAKLNPKVEYPPPYERVFWGYSRAEKASINRAINAIDWDELFANKTVEFQVSELTDLLLNIYSNYIPNKTVLCDDKDPPWMTNGIRTAIEMKNNSHKEHIRSGMRHNYYVRLENLTIELSNLIRDTKTEYDSKLAAKLVNPSTSAKTYWSILKTFANGRKVPVIPPLLINNEFISNFKTKANHFDRSFNQECTAISTDSSIPCNK